MGLDPVSWMAIAAGVGAVASVGSTVYSMTNKPKKPDTPLPSNKDAEMAAYAEAERARKRRAAGTLVTGGEGVPGAAPTRKTLLGE